jgi:SAM-dependent methyltransferase
MADTSSVTSAWDAYWRGSGSSPLSSDKGVDHPYIRLFWVDALSARLRTGNFRLLDVASGDGALVDIACDVLGAESLDVTCIDISAAAIQTLAERKPFVEGIIGNAADMPFVDGSFDIAASQFGVEYAGLDAVRDMVRVVTPGGVLALLMHLKGGVIDRECAADVTALDQFQATGFIPAARSLFAEAQRCIRGKTGGSRADYDAAVDAMIPISRRVETLLREHGHSVARGMLAMLHRETDRIYGRIMHHDLNEVLEWLERMEAELASYRGRMQSMCDVANTAATFKSMTEHLKSDYLEIETSEPLRDESGRDIAWKILARKRSAS